MTLSPSDKTRLERWNKILPYAKLPMSANSLADFTGISSATSYRDCVAMVDQGFMTLIKKDGLKGRNYFYQANAESVDLEKYEPMKPAGLRSADKKMAQRIEGATFYNLTDTVHHTRRTPQRRCAFIGNSLETMSF